MLILKEHSEFVYVYEYFLLPNILTSETSE